MNNGIMDKEIFDKFRADVKTELLKIAERHHLDYLTEAEATKMADAISDSTIQDCLEEETTAEEYADLLTY